jgi:hypothetical protein
MKMLFPFLMAGFLGAILLPQRSFAEGEEETPTKSETVQTKGDSVKTKGEQKVTQLAKNAGGRKELEKKLGAAANKLVYGFNAKRTLKSATENMDANKGMSLKDALVKAMVDIGHDAEVAMKIADNFGKALMQDAKAFGLQGAAAERFAETLHGEGSLKDPGPTGDAARGVVRALNDAAGANDANLLTSTEAREKLEKKLQAAGNKLVYGFNAERTLKSATENMDANKGMGLKDALVKAMMDIGHDAEVAMKIADNFGKALTPDAKAFGLQGVAAERFAETLHGEGSLKDPGPTGDAARGVVRALNNAAHADGNNVGDVEKIRRTSRPRQESDARPGSRDLENP